MAGRAPRSILLATTVLPSSATAARDGPCGNEAAITTIIIALPGRSLPRGAMSSAEYIVDQAHPPLPEERPVRLRPLEREPVIVEPPAPEIAPPPIRSRLLSSLVPPPSRI